MNQELETTHISGNECKKKKIFHEIEDGVYEVRYDGTLITLTKETYSSMKHREAKLTSENQNLSQRLEVGMRNFNKLKKEYVKSQKDIEDLKRQLSTLNSKLRETENKLSKFTSNKGRSSKLTPDVKNFIASNLNKGYTVSQIYRELAVTHKIDISYETVRRFASEHRVSTGMNT